MKLFLIGLPGSGKTTAARKVAEKYSLRFVDLDEEIVNSEGKPITKIFTESGEDYFRKKETENLQNIIKRYPEFVLATGGGTPCFFTNLQLMKEAGKVIFLNTPFDTIAKRLASQKASRPLLKNSVSVLDRIIELFSARSEYYKEAHFTANNEEELLYYLDNTDIL